jgi:hypothetical protein
VLEQKSISRRRAALKKMPKKLDDAFQATIDRICRQSQSLGEPYQLGMEILKWTYLTERQLEIDELRHALAVMDSTTDSLDPSDLPFEACLTYCCYGLVVFDKETSSVRLVHKSLQHFLNERHESNERFQNGHRDIARTCLKYMRFRDTDMTSDPSCDCSVVEELYNYSCYVSSSDCKDRLVSSLHIEKYPFLKYAIHYWGRHAKKQIDQEVTDLAVTILLDKQDAQCISHNLLL